MSDVICGLCVTTNDWIDLTGVDKATYETAKKIEKLSHGLTPKQFTEAVSIALSLVSGHSILSTQVVPDLNKQD